MAAAGSAQITEEVFSSVNLIKWTWISGTGETVLADCTTDSFYTGQVLALITVPGGSTEAPTDNYDVTIIDKNNCDILLDNGLNRATGTTEGVAGYLMGAVANSQLELNIAGAGSSNTGIVYLWLR